MRSCSLLKLCALAVCSYDVVRGDGCAWASREQEDTAEIVVRESFKERPGCAELKQAGQVYLEWAWLGGLLPEEVRLKARLNCVVQAPEVVKAVVVPEGNADQEKWYAAESIGKFGMASIVLGGLSPRTKYRYFAWVINSEEDEKRPSNQSITGTFETPAWIGEPYDFEFGFASCADNHSNSVIFDVIREHGPLFFLHTGDLHYGNVEIDDPAVFHGMYDQVMANPRQAKFFRTTPIAYMWDDHDFGPNNSHKGSPGRESSIKAFLEAVPSYPLAAYTLGDLRTKKRSILPSVFYAFSVGRVRFVVTDTSSSKVPDKTALGHEQLKWFKQELLQSSKTHGLIFWVSTMPWLVAHDKWGEFKKERNDIVQFVTEHDLQKKMILLSGDAHMLALDDGTNSFGGIPVFQAAALDAKPTSKGGPYSHGIYPGRGQYGWIQVRDDVKSDRPCVFFTGHNVDPSSGKQETLLYFDTCDENKRSPANAYYPSPLWLEKLWKRIKKEVVPIIPYGDDLMVFFDSFRYSAGMVWDRFALPMSFALGALYLTIKAMK